VQVKLEYFLLKNKKFAPIFKLPLINWCDFNTGVSKKSGSSFFKLFINSIAQSAAGMMKKCPYEGVYS
jgi:hypothetical protein